jgi:hypothetical protein
MSDNKGWGQTVLGWFITNEGRPAADPSTSLSDEEIISQAAGSQPQEPAVDTSQMFTGELPQAKGGKVDFPAVYAAAGIDPEEQSRIARASDLLKSLPAGTDAALKKQIVQASLTAFGVPIEKIIEAGVEEIQALEGYIRAGAADTTKVTEESAKRIAQYEEEMKALRLIMQERVEEQQSVMKSCNEKKLEIQSILEFFGREAVERVVKASPKLVDPTSPETNA